jgi:glycosyltransferase involved in cell wall biosynthesis
VLYTESESVASNSPSPLITIGLPVHNAANCVADALRSILAQTLTDWELVVVDDGSTDASLEIIGKVRDQRILLLPQDGQRRGLAARLNQITRLARGRYLARMDADDMMHPGRLLAQLEFLRNHPAVDVVGCGLLMVDAALQPVGAILNPEAHERICCDAVRRIGLAHATMLADTSWWRANPYEERNFRCEDWRLLYSARDHSRFANLMEALYYYRVFDSFSLSKYAAHKLRSTRLWWELPREECSWGRALGLTCRSWLDLGVYAAASASGLRAGLIRRRGVPVSPAMRERFFEALRQIRATPLSVDQKFVEANSG